MTVQRHKTRVNVALLKYAQRGWLLWENKTGVAWVKARRGMRPVRYGLPGSPDIIGIASRKITPADVGKTVGQFVGIEVKVGSDPMKDNQKRFSKRMQELGGLFILERDE